MQKIFDNILHSAERLAILLNHLLPKFGPHWPWPLLSAVTFYFAVTRSKKQADFAIKL